MDFYHGMVKARYLISEKISVKLFRAHPSSVEDATRQMANRAWATRANGAKLQEMSINSTHLPCRN